MAQFHSSLWLSNIPFFIYQSISSINLHLGCFHILVIESNATVTRYLFELLFVYVVFGKTPESGIAGLNVSSVKLLGDTGS